MCIAFDPTLVQQDPNLALVFRGKEFAADAGPSGLSTGGPLLAVGSPDPGCLPDQMVPFGNVGREPCGVAVVGSGVGQIPGQLA